MLFHNIVYSYKIRIYDLYLYIRINYMIYDREIENLIYNIEKPKKPLRIDIILEGGGFNGSYEVGVLLFLSKLEECKYIKVERISGASIGSLLGLLYFTNQLEDYTHFYEKIRNYWKKNGNLSIFQTEVCKIIETINPETFSDISNNKLFITYNNIITKEQTIQSTYVSPTNLKQAILSSCHIPFLSNNNICHENYFIDGGQPYIFENREYENNHRLLYVCINQIYNMKSILQVKDKNGNGKILTGILNCYNLFFQKTNNSMCSFIDKWNTTDYILLRMKQFVITILVYMIYVYYTLHNKYMVYVQDLSIFKMLYPIWRDLYKDIIFTWCF